MTDQQFSLLVTCCSEVVALDCTTSPDGLGGMVAERADYYYYYRREECVRNATVERTSPTVRTEVHLVEHV